VLLQSLNQIVLGLIVYFIIANSSVPENNQHSKAHICLQKKIEHPMFQNQVIDTYNIFLFSKFTFPQLRQHIIVSKLQLKLSSFVLFLGCLHERLKNVLRIFLEY